MNETRPVFKLIIGIDPGATGALAFLADGRFDQVIDMPTVARKAGGEEINGATLAALLRGARAQHPGAHVLAVLEAVSAMPGQGVSGMFRFGESAGCIRGVLQGVGIPFIRVQPLTWKKHSGVAVAGTSKLSGPEKSAAQRAAKDLARARAIELYPEAAAELARKKDVGRADALLMARWAHATDQIARAA